MSSVDDLVGDGMHLDVAEVFQEQLLLFAAEQDKRVRRDLFVKAVEQLRQFVAVELLQNGGDLLRVQLFEQRFQVIFAVFAEEARYVLL